MDVGTLVLHRFNGREIYAVKYPTIQVIERNGAIELLLYVETKVKPVQTLPDTAELDPQPNAEVYIALKKLDASKLLGRRFAVPASWDDEKQDQVSCLYYCEHCDLNKNVLRFLERDGNKFLVHWTATTRDVNYYDGSKPDTKFELKAWFTFKDICKWSSTEPGAAADPAL